MSNVNAEIKMQGNNDAWFTTNAAVVYPANVVIYHTDGRYKYTDGVTALSALTFRGAGGSATWGGITGTLSNQTDLQTVLNNKEPLKGSDDNYVTDAQLVVIGNTSGTNSGDNATNTTSNTYADGKITQVITNGVTDKAPSEDAVFDALALKASLTGVETLTNKRITRRVTSIVSSATPTVNTDSCDMVRITAQAANITSMTSGLSGTHTEGQLLHYQMLAAVAYTIAWGASFEAKGQALPTVFTANKRLNVLFSWDSVTAKWGCLDAIVEA